MKIAVIQMDIALGLPKINRQRVEQRVRNAAAQGARVVILPEMWNTGYSLQQLSSTADDSGQPSLRLLQSLASELKVHIIGGSVASRQEEGFFNHAMVVNDQGRLICQYDKVHLFRLMDEHKYIQPGRSVEPFVMGDVNWGLIICYDLRFPELARKLAVAGAEVLVVPAQWPKARLHHWRSLLIARAIENQQYVLGINRVGSDAKNQFGGHSMVIDPLGEIIAEAGEEEEIIFVSLDFEQVKQVRQSIPVFQDRNPQCY